MPTKEELQRELEQLKASIGADKNQDSSRQYKGMTKVDHDLYKLEVSKVKKNTSYTDVPNFVDVEHTHFFHSHDSNGRPLKNSSSVAGHSHRVIWRKDEKGDLIAECGPAIRIIGGKEYPYYAARGVRITDPQSGDVVKRNIADNHTHDVTYLYSEKIEQRVQSTKAQEAMRGKIEYEAENQRPLPQQG